MLQTRLENEQFDSLPNIRSQNGFISTDRPDSSQRVDLHIYIIPKSVWRNVQHLAQNEAMNDAISVGFVRVSPDMNLYNLRQSIEKLCRTENYFPRDFIFLRSVGRCLTRVKSAQEEELKVKNYRPPQTLAPEIYLLEGRHEDYAYIVSASPALSSASYLFGNRYQRRSHLNDYGRPLSRYSHRRPLNAEKFNSPARNTNDLKPHLPSTERKKWAGGGTHIDSDLDDSSSSTKDLFKLREEQERLRQRQGELERMRREAEEKKAQSERGEHEHRPQKKTRSADKEDERLRQRQVELERMRRDAEEKKAQLEREKSQRQRRQEEEAQSERAEHERRLQEKAQSLDKEDERLRQQQAELERMRRDAEEKKAQSEREKSQKQRRQEEKAQSEVVEHEHRPQKKTQSVDKEDEHHRQRQAELERIRRNAEEKKAQLEREKSQRQRRQEEKAQSERVEHERRLQEKAQAEREAEARHQRRRQGKLDAEQRRLKLEALATNIQASFRGFKARQAFRERQIKDIKNDSRISSSKTNTTIKNSITNKEKPYINDDDELSDGSEILSRSSSIGSTSHDDSNSSRTETRTIKTEDRESINSNSSSSSLSSIKSERKAQSNLSSYSKIEDYLSMKNNIDDKDLRTATVTKIRHPEEELLHVSTPDINDDDTYELERRAAEAKRRQKSEGEKPKIKELEEQRRESVTPQQNGDREALVIRLQKLRTDRTDLEKVRDDAIKHLKSIHNRITLRRKEARDMWKKKYFREKKITAPLEQHVTQSSTNLDKIHKKIIQTIDNECKNQVQMGNSKEAETGNFILQTTRVQHEIQDVRRQVDQAKLRLATDVKLRNQAENECRVLRQELNQAKTNLNQIKNRTEI